MSTLEALNAISEAIEAHKLLPDVQRQLKEAREALEYALLERDEERHTNETLKTLCEQLENRLIERDADIRTLRETIAELNDRNTSLDTSLTDVTRLYNDAQHTLSNKEQVINILSADKAALLIRLEESKGVVSRLTDTLKSIGASIVAAVEVPEVTSESPFPVDNSLGLSDSSSDTFHNQSNAEPVPVLDESPRTDLVTSDTAPGTFPYRYW